MKRKFFLFVLLTLSICGHAQKKQALLVAIGQYPPESRIRSIAAVNDLKYLKPTLVANGFTPANITTLINEKATRKGIISSLKNLAAKAGKNDIICISFGCHGQQIRDQQTVAEGKDEDDGYDEALVPYDARSRFSMTPFPGYPNGYKGENHLRDDDLYPLLMQIRKKIGNGGSLLILLDACHSGTGTRADDFPGSRGEPEPFADPSDKFDPTALPDTDAKLGFFADQQDSLANMVVFSGAGPHQINKQVLAGTEELGSLSWAFCEAMKSMPPQGDYGTLFRKIRSLIQSRVPEQMPMVEGNTSQLVFSGKYSSMQDRNMISVGLKGNKSTGDSVFTLNKGRFDNLFSGSRGRIVLSGTDETVCKATLKKTEPFASVGLADCLLQKNIAYEFRPDEEQVPALAAVIRIDPGHPVAAKTEKEIRKSLSVLPFVQFGNESAAYSLSSVIQNSEQLITLTDRNQRQLWVATGGGDSLAASDKTALVSAIRRSMQAQYLRTLEDGGELLPKVETILLTGDGLIPDTSLQLKEDDRYCLRITNNSDARLFYTVLDILPDNKLDIIYPYEGKEPADYSIPAGGRVERKLAVSKNSPAGVEFLKVIVSTEPMDLRMVIEDPGRRPGLRSFEVLVDQLFNSGNNGQAVRADFSALTAAEIGISTLSLTIQKN